jgi:adenylate cyclase
VSDAPPPDFAQTLRSRFAALLFADVSGSTKLYESVGDTLGLRTIRGYVEMMRKATEARGGRVVKTIGDEVMAVFSSADAAARAAMDMHVGAAEVPHPREAGMRLQLRIGIHGGPVLQKENDVFGDTVNLAARLSGQAQGGQIILSRATAGALGPEMRAMARDLYGVQVKGKSEEVALSELVWKGDEDATVLAALRAPAPKAAASVLRLRYRDAEVARRRDADSEVLGRDPECGVQVADHMASRRHCTIERRKDKWVLKDHSTNGTFVTLEGDAELTLRREEIVLRRHGWIAFGQSRAGTAEVVEFFVD